ncbi:AgmX/PglI C-terminal domain-containing protein [Myxococcota bacterium]|nr:AgmX/PglI C-terminal domain-containing protein [Myxococcota bacterium]
MKHLPQRLRVAVLWHDTLLQEATPRPGAAVTIGANPKSTLMIPRAAGVEDHHTLLTYTPDEGYTLRLTPQMVEGTLRVDDAPRSLNALRQIHGAAIPLQPGQHGTLDLGPLAIFFQIFEGEERAPRRPLWAQAERGMLGALLAALTLHFGVLLTAFLLWDVNVTPMAIEEVIRYIDVISLPPEPEPEAPEPEPEAPDEDVGKKAGGEEGEFGEPDKIEASKVPKRDGDLTDKIKDTGVHKALNTSLMGSGALSNVFGNQDQFSDSLSAAMAGGDGPLVLGYGMGGMGMRGTGSGGGGDGFGRIHGMGHVDTGGGRGTKANLRGRKATKKKARVRPGNLGLSGFCKEQDIVRVVNIHQRGVQYCYEKALARNPELSGKITLSWRIGLDGKVQKVIIEGSTLNSLDVEGCIKRNIERWSFPRPEGGMCQIRFPFVFNAGL